MSAAVHVALLGVVAAVVASSSDDEPAAEAAAAPREVDIETIDGYALEKPPVDVVVVDVVALAPPAAATAAAADPARRATAPAAAVARGVPAAPAIATTRRGETAAPATAGAEPAATGPAARPPGQPLATDDVLERIAAGGKPMPPPIVKSGRVAETGGGRAKIDDGVTTVSIDSDGEAHFHDKPSFEVHFLPGLSELEDAGHGVAALIDAWEKDPYAIVKQAGRSQDQPETVLAVPGAADSFSLAPPGDSTDTHETGGTVTLLGGKFDLTDFAMRKLGMDPYAGRKRALLEKTFDERAERGAVYRKEQLDRSAELVRGNLEQLWRSTADAAARKEALFEMWDECVEGDDSTGESGQRARLEVVGWIRARLPAGSPGAFTADDIAKLSAKRTSKQAFAPYDE
nr:hypothetical protein [Kofleriaceae bacterium]